MKTALLLIDIQNDYFPGGRYEVARAVESSQVAGQLLAHFRAHGWPIVHIQHFSTRPGAGFLLPDSVGAAIHENVAPLAVEPVIPKHYPNSFQATGLADFLTANAIEQLVICGMMSQMCIDTTVRAAFERGYVCRVAQDACAAREQVFDGQKIPAETVHAAFMAALAGVFATVEPAGAIMAHLQSGQ